MRNSCYPSPLEFTKTWQVKCCRLYCCFKIWCSLFAAAAPSLLYQKSEHSHDDGGESGERCCVVFLSFCGCVRHVVCDSSSALYRNVTFCVETASGLWVSISHGNVWLTFERQLRQEIMDVLQQQGMAAATAQPCCRCVPVATSSPATKIPCIPKSIFSTGRYYRRAVWNCKQC